MRALQDWLADLAVGRKLMLAFGLVSALSLLAIVIALQAADRLVEGNRQSQLLADINLLLGEARQAEKDFALAPDQASAERVRTAMAALAGKAATLQRHADAATGVALQDIEHGGADYLARFAQFVSQRELAERARQDMQAQAEEARLQVEFVERDMFDALRVALGDQAAMSGDTLTFAENAASLLRVLLAVRNREYTFVQGGGEQPLREWGEFMQTADGAVAALLAGLGAEHEDVLQAARQALVAYRQAFEHYRTSRAASQQSATDMQGFAAAVLAQADRARDEHLQRLEMQRVAIMRLLAVSGGVILLLAGAASLVIRQLLLPPLQRTLALAQRIAAGDLSHREADDGRRDELGQLGQAMGLMTENLRGMVARLGQGIDQLHGAAEQLSQSSRLSDAGARAQQRETEQAAAATQQLASSAEEVSRNAGQAAEAALQANRNAHDGDRVVGQSAAQIVRLAADVEQSMSTIRRLHQGSERIGGVLDVIKAVAEQTNLLALNAAIEAARAGEQGRGFAVVADEVRALAQRTQQSTAEIEGLIAELQQLSERAVQQMAGSAQLSQEAVGYGEQARQALILITGAVGSIEAFNQQIASSAVEQSAVAEEISRNVVQVRRVAEQGVVSNAQMAAASGELARLGGELQALVQQFRL
ncbi:methyl-accepting chemotaxis protein [Pseudomonas sp. UL073]|uniref:Methyl-accepting chemotaxis protein n=1 Tax=Zestomonas insulae TaxID=2809017 RepID=A0ABS2IBL8_9GAMM|nr:methyl-accepting chemotaxis protein [Pseudomonas insulae]MBM7059302.1 methyl-accepting chemotaxis protein [Pseudomonas insulae]